jgi:hypothetical protein
MGLMSMQQQVRRARSSMGEVPVRTGSIAAGSVNLALQGKIRVPCDKPGGSPCTIEEQWDVEDECARLGRRPGHCCRFSDGRTSVDCGEPILNNLRSLAQIVAGA